MSARAPLVSVVVPTRERSAKLRYTLETILSRPDPDFEVIVSDNASQDGTEEMVGQIRDDRLRYFRTSSRLSMADNWEFAYARTAGRYLTYIGDDDALTVDAIAAARSLIGSWPSSLYFWDPDIYRWPGEGCSAALVYHSPRTETHRVSLAERVRFSFRWGGLRYIKLPLLYHSLVERPLLERIRSETGRLFHSTQPDVFMAFALPVFCDEAVLVGRGLSIYGATENRSDTRTVGRVESAFSEKLLRFIREYGDYPLHRELDPSVPFWVNMIPDAMLVARDFFPDYYRDKPFDFDAMWAFLWRYWRFDSISGIAARRASFRKHHSFHLWRFLAFVSAHVASELRIKARRAIGRDPGAFELRDCPENIAEFAHRMASIENSGPARAAAAI